MTAATGDSNNNNNKHATTVDEQASYVKGVRPSIRVLMIRHAESANNQVYYDACHIYRRGTPDFDIDGWTAYVDKHRQADPGLSHPVGHQQATLLAEQYLIPTCANLVSQPVRIITSPMRRALESIRPTVQGLVRHFTTTATQQQQQEQQQQQHEQEQLSTRASPMVQVLTHGFYFESEGCHIQDHAEEGMNPAEIRAFLTQNDASNNNITNNTNTNSNPLVNVDFVGFPDPDRGWYVSQQRSESRSESEARAAKFYVWLCDQLDQQLQESFETKQMQSQPNTRSVVQDPEDVFDAGTRVPGEELEREHDVHQPRLRRRRTTILMGHGDFMSLVLKRIMAGFGHSVEATGVPHRSAMVHFNTGITELEYFGHGRFLIMASNQTPHIPLSQYDTLRTGGSLKDGWSYLIPNGPFVSNAEVSIAFEDELQDHVREQTEALKALYLSSNNASMITMGTADAETNEDNNNSSSNIIVEQDETHALSKTQPQRRVKHFIVKRGLEVVGVATYAEETNRLYDVAVRPSAHPQVSVALIRAAQDHARRLGRTGSLLITSRSGEYQNMLSQMGLEEAEPMDDENCR